ncbi:MAG: branched-chain amino acid ABC transporter permease [Synergistaceae bacterium]|jgi:branched-chain amino acid transport system permease protein|nr:branched-chain amino acid ABC transporter permease [Synergistaceae bacterium]
MPLPIFMQYLIGGLAIGAVYSLIAVGYSMIWKTMGLLNFAQGPAVMFSGFLGITALTLLPKNFPPLLTLMAVLTFACCVSALISVVIHKMVHEPTFKSSLKLRNVNYEKMNVLVATLAVGVLLENTAKIIWTGEPRFFSLPIGRSVIQAGSIIFPSINLWILCIAALIVFLLQLFLYKTRAGKAMRAVALDKEAAALMGINVRRSIQATFTLAYVLGAVAGILVSPIIFAYFAHGQILGLKGFSSAILGGIYSVPGAICGGLLLGVLESFGAAFVGAGYRNTVAFIVLIAVLLIRPTGLFAKKASEKL